MMYPSCMHAHCLIELSKAGELIGDFVAIDISKSYNTEQCAVKIYI